MIAIARHLAAQSVRTKLVLLATLVALPMVGLIIWSGLQGREEALAAARVQSQRLADSLVAEQQATVAGAQQLCYALAQQPELRARDPRIRSMLVELLRLTPDLLNIVIADTEGRVWAQASGVSGVNLADRRHFRNALATGRLSSGEFVVSRSRGTPAFHFGYPYRDGAGRIAGVIAVSISLEQFRTILARSQLPSAASYALLDHQGLVLARGIDQERYLGQPFDRARFEAMVNGPDAESALQPGLDDVMRVGSFRKLRLPGEAEPYMYVRAGIPLAAVLGAANRELARNLAVSLAIVLLAVTLVAVIGHQAFATPIQALEEASRRLAAGDLSVRVGDRVQGGELGSLGRSFDRMAAELTERQRALTESELEYRDIFEGSQDAILVLSADDGVVVDANRQAERIFGQDREALGRTSPEALAGEPVAGAREMARRLQLARTEGPQTFEWQARRGGGECFWCEVNLSATTVGGEGRLLAIVRDVSERKAAAAQNHELQARLLQSQKMESVGRLAGGVAHDFNNMLAVILGEAELLKVKLPPEHPAVQAAIEIERAGLRSRDITRQLLAFSRKQVVRPRRVDLDAVVEATRKTLARLVGEDLTLDFCPAAGAWPVLVDPAQVDQVLVNLVVNARDAMPSGGAIRLEVRNVTLTEADVRGHPGRPAGDYVRLSVIDHGIGMDEATLAHVFEPFFTLKGVGQGTGLGLATVYGIVTQCGGFVEAASAVGRGSTFDVYFPRTTLVLEEAPAEPPPATSGKGTILLVEDDELVRRTAVRMLESLGYSVLAVEVPGEALSLCRDQRRQIDLLLTDVVMPGLKGPDLARQVVELRPGLPVLYMSGYTSNVVLSHGVAEERGGYLQKPFSRAQIAAKVGEVLAAASRSA
jgi:PAS domain S-box-containing protein